MSKLRKKELDAEFEEVIASGEGGKKGVKYAKEHFKNEEKKEKDKALLTKELLEKNTKRGPYTRYLASLLLQGLQTVDWPIGWTYHVAPTDIGVVMEIKTKEGRLFRSAFKSSGDGYYDLNAINNFTERAWLLIDKVGHPNGIITL